MWNINLFCIPEEQIKFGLIQDWPEPSSSSSKRLFLPESPELNPAPRSSSCDRRSRSICASSSDSIIGLGMATDATYLDPKRPIIDFTVWNVSKFKNKSNFSRNYPAADSVFPWQTVRRAPLSRRTRCRDCGGASPPSAPWPGRWRTGGSWPLAMSLREAGNLTQIFYLNCLKKKIFNG